MKSFLIQTIAFLFIALTPIACWFALPLYVLINCLLAFASFVSLIATSKQIDNQLKIDENGGAWKLVQGWYWINVVLAAPCVAVAMLVLIAGGQRGDYVVDHREVAEINDLAGRVDALFGRSRNAKNPRDRNLLLAYVLLDPNRTYEKATFNGGDGTDVSATNVSLDSKGTSSFGYGSGWNRINDRLVIQDREFSRGRGNVFLILQTDENRDEIIQLPGTCNANRIEDVIRYAQEKSQEIGETRLQSIRTNKK